jgi:hypothetical protein
MARILQLDEQVDGVGHQAVVEEVEAEPVAEAGDPHHR